MRDDPTMSESERVRALLEENLKFAKDIYASTEKTRRYILWGQIFGWVKLLVVIIPLILGYLYLQPYLKSVVAMYQNLFSGSSRENTSQGIDPGLLNKLQELQNSGKLK